jgi:hypothetical protein
VKESVEALMCMGRSCEYSLFLFINDSRLISRLLRDDILEKVLVTS